jgi:alpha-ribazole phosphatase
MRLRLRQSPGGLTGFGPLFVRRSPQSAGKVNKQLLLLRHAQHAAAKFHTFIGSTDIELSEEGRQQTASMDAFFQAYHPERCFCSPLKRCIETIRTVSGIPVEIHPDLREIDFGHWEGKTFDQIVAIDPAVVDRWACFDPEFTFPGGEGLREFLLRVERVATTIVSGPEKTVLVVTHAGVIRALLCHFLGLLPRQYLLFDIQFGSLAILDLFGDKGVLSGLNCFPR